MSLKRVSDDSGQSGLTEAKGEFCFVFFFQGRGVSNTLEDRKWWLEEGGS